MLQGELDLIVLGGGPAGVAAAYLAARKGQKVVLVERALGPGGMAGSFAVDGIRVDYGSHRLHPTIDPAVLGELRRLLGDELERRPRSGRIRLAGRWIGFPLRGADLLRNLPPSFSLGAARDALLSPRRRPRADTFAEVLGARLGPTLCERFYFPYARKLWGLEPEEIAGEQARRRVSADSPWKLLARAFGQTKSDSGSFWYPRGGYGRISERLAEAAAEAGADLRFETAAERVELRAHRARVSLAGGTVIEARRVWSTIPLPVLATIADPAPPSEALAAAGTLESRSMLLVYLTLDTDRYTAYDAHYLPESFTPVTRISEPKNYRSGNDPPGRTALCAEIPCSVRDAVWSATDDELAGLVLETLAAAGLPQAPVTSATVRRLERAYPIYRVGFDSAFAALDAWSTREPSLLTFGRQGLFVHDNAHHALAMAWAAADALDPDGQFDGRAWEAARRRFSEHVVED